ncbi:hypothetical protein [Phenylobacterium sp.]|uniref:hypothetical protein n=1 Tax=Phenylobacterium sp. TaxID=1871053 RepID=UPI00272EFB30|nr:hypothetical protein [Phenylobacterium sp.]MDP1874417.1 hypothetical protein [Phenylobacterium sp.]
MQRLVLLTLAALWTSAASAAQPQDPPPFGPGPQGGEVFISPSGEPFRGPGGLAAWLTGADRDGDGLVTAPEFEADALRVFARLDTDQNGVIDGFETQAYEREIAPEIRRLGEARSPGGGGGPGADSERPRRPLLGMGRGARPSPREGAARYGLLNEPHPVRGADADLSGRVSLEEWRKAAARRFALLDLDGDGVLTLDTLPRLGGEAPRR